jgi:serine/threonine protein kinase
MATQRRPTATRNADKAPGSPSDRSPRAPLGTAHSSETGRSYRLDRLIGKGGFGEVYLATPTPQGGYPAQVCIKISDRMSGWLREAYFAEMLIREPRALRVYDRFVEVHGDGMRYCLAMEYAEHGDLGAWLAKKGAQSERFVRREIAAILSALDSLHRGQALHRDLTPFNVFVCGDDEQLKLGDFGIATHQMSRRGVTAEAFNPFNAPTEIAWGRVRRWQQRDDIYQVGLIATMLLRGDIDSPVRSKDVRALECSDHLKEVLHRCIGARGKRYEAAKDLIAALKTRPRQVRLGRLASLEGRRVAFTGFLSRPRSEAIASAKKAGAIFQSKPGQSTDVLVRGRPNTQQIAGDHGGLKLMEIKRLAAQGHSVTVIGEKQFWKLIEPKTKARAKAKKSASKTRTARTAAR